MVRLGQRSVAIDAKFPFETVEKLGPEEPLTKAAERAIRPATWRPWETSTWYRTPAPTTSRCCTFPAMPSICAALPAPRTCWGKLCTGASCAVGPSGLYLYLHTVGHALRGVRLAAAGLELADTLQRARDEVHHTAGGDPALGEPALAARPRPRRPPYRAAQPRRPPWNGSPAAAPAGDARTIGPQDYHGLNSASGAAGAGTRRVHTASATPAAISADISAVT